MRGYPQNDKKATRKSGLILLEHLHGRFVSNAGKCPNPKAPRLLGVNRAAKTAIYVKAACKQWSCPVCGINNGRRWVARILHGVNHYIRQGDYQWYLMTITARKDWRGTESSLKCIRTGWRRLSNRIWRKWGKGYYVKVFEHHEDGSFHLHVLTNIEIDYETKFAWNDERRMLEPTFSCRWLKDNAAQCGLGYQADYRPVPNAGIIAWYVAKYLGKSIGDGGRDWPKHLRRIQTSHNWPDLPVLSDASEYEWTYIPNREKLMQHAFALWFSDDILVTDVDQNRDLNSDDWGWMS